MNQTAWILLSMLAFVLGFAITLLYLRFSQEDGANDTPPDPRLDEVLRRLETLEVRMVEDRGLGERMDHSLRELRTGLQGTLSRVVQVESTLQARLDVDRAMADAVRRLETMMAGTTSKGEAGEMVVEQILGALPSEWVERNARFGNRVVEFAIRLPGGRLLPVDSKWPATGLLSRLAQTTEPDEARSLRRAINDEVMRKASELSKYVDEITSPGFGVMVVPDAVFEVCLDARSKALRSGVAVVSHSLLMPYVLMVVHAFPATDSRAGEVEARSMEEAKKALEDAQKELENRFSKGLTMLNNAAQALRKSHMKAISHIEASMDINRGDSVEPQEGAPSREG